jgi:hypothetical protein
VPRIRGESETGTETDFHLLDEKERGSFQHGNFASSSTRLFRAFLDTFDLFRAVMPVRHGRLIASVPTIGMQFANDCEWIVSEASKLVRNKAASSWERPKLLEVEATLRNVAELGRQNRDEQLVRADQGLTNRRNPEGKQN